MSIKDLLLSEDTVIRAVNEFATEIGAAVEGPKKTDKYVEFTLKVTGQLPATLQVFTTRDGTWTLHFKTGKNHELSCKLAEHIAQYASKKAPPRPLKLGFITEADWHFLISHLRDDYSFEITDETNTHYARYRVIGGPGDEVLLHRFPTTGSFLMQGKTRNVAGVVSSILCELVKDKADIITAQLQTFDVDSIKIEDILLELEQSIPTGRKILGETGCAIIAPSLALLKLKVSLTDYTAFVFPALRGLEAYLKALFLSKGYIVKNNIGFSDFFVDQIVKREVASKLGLTLQAAIEQSYRLFNQHRPGLLHADANPETSRIIESHEEAMSIVQDVLRTIERTASTILT